MTSARFADAIRALSPQSLAEGCGRQQHTHGWSAVQGPRGGQQGEPKRCQGKAAQRPHVRTSAGSATGSPTLIGALSMAATKLSPMANIHAQSYEPRRS